MLARLHDGMTLISRTAYIEYRKGSAETGDALLLQLEKDRTIFDRKSIDSRRECGCAFDNCRGIAD